VDNLVDFHTAGPAFISVPAVIRISHFGHWEEHPAKIADVLWEQF